MKQKDTHILYDIKRDNLYLIWCSMYIMSHKIYMSTYSTLYKFKYQSDLSSQLYTIYGIKILSSNFVPLNFSLCCTCAVLFMLVNIVSILWTFYKVPWYLVSSNCSRSHIHLFCKYFLISYIQNRTVND